MSCGTNVSGNGVASTSRKVWVFVTVLVIGIAVLIVGGLAVRDSYLRIPQVSFDQVKWSDWLEIAPDNGVKPTIRQTMMRDLLTNVLPGLNGEEIEAILGRSVTREDFRRRRPEDLQPGKAVPNEEGKMVFRGTGTGYYYDEYDWDLTYYIGTERTFLYNHQGNILDSPLSEQLIIRLGRDGVFESWYIAGSKRWPKIVGEEAASRYRKHRE